MKGATEEAQGRAGLVPAPGIGETNLFLRSDGQWAEVTGGAGAASTAKVYQVTVQDEETQLEAIDRIVNGAALNNGDIAVVKVLIADDKYEYTAYVYNGANWVAMDGNYSAENVYFTSDFVFTEKIGTVQELTNGRATRDAAGKNLQEFFSGLFGKAQNPTVTQPSVSIALSGAGAKEVGTQVTPSYTVTFKPGTYSFGPATGVTATHKVTDTEGNVAEGDTGTLPAIVIGDNTSYGVTVESTYTDGVTPNNNLGTGIPELKITGGTKTASAGTKFTGYRNCFYGTLTTKAEELTSADIRGLTATNKAVANGSTVTMNITGNAGVVRAVFAYPATLRDLTEVIDKNDSNANIVSAFSQKLGTIEVEGANGYDAIEYKVWIQDFAAEYNANNVYTFKI